MAEKGSLHSVSWGRRSYLNCGWFHPVGWDPGTERKGRSKMNASAHTSLLPPCGHNVTSCLKLQLSCLPHHVASPPCWPGPLNYEPMSGHLFIAIRKVTNNKKKSGNRSLAAAITNLSVLLLDFRNWLARRLWKSSEMLENPEGAVSRAKWATQVGVWKTRMLRGTQSVEDQLVSFREEHNSIKNWARGHSRDIVAVRSAPVLRTWVRLNLQVMN